MSSRRARQLDPPSVRAPGAAGTVGTGPGFDPSKLITDVDEGADRLEAAAAQMYDATYRFEEAEEVYERLMANARLEADLDHENTRAKMPSQERRNDMALRAVREQNLEQYTEYHAARANKEALAVRYRALAAAVSARQTLLKAIGGAGG